MYVRCCHAVFKAVISLLSSLSELLPVQIIIIKNREDCKQAFKKNKPKRTRFPNSILAKGGSISTRSIDSDTELSASPSSCFTYLSACRFANVWGAGGGEGRVGVLCTILDVWFSTTGSVLCLDTSIHLSGPTSSLSK